MNKSIQSKYTSTLLALGIVSAIFSGSVLAGTYTPVCKNIPVSIPCETSAWDVGFEVFWVEASTNDQVYAYSTTPNIEPYYSVEPDYSLGFELEASLHFGTGNDVTVSWERAHDDNHATNAQAVTLYASTPISGTGVAGARHNATHDYEFDAVNGELGQLVNFGDDLSVRFHAGLQYAHIDYLKFITLDADTATPDTYMFESNFEGVGGRVGGDASYNIANAWSAVGHAAFALLVGDVETFAHDSSSPRVGYQIISMDVVVPTAMVKTGFSYYTDAMDGLLTVEGGWRWEGYFGSLRFYSTVGANYENFTFHGPYVSVLYVS